MKNMKIAGMRKGQATADKKTMKLSLTIPAYNEEAFIEACLKCIRLQTEPPDEVIVVDNNCTDKTAALAKKMGARVIKEKKQGMIQARNAGFNAAKYEILARCDADTLLPKHWIERVKHNFSTYRIDAVSGPVVYPDHPLLKSPYPSLTYSRAMQEIARTPILVGAHMAITKSIWGQVRTTVNLDNKLVHEDIDLSLNISKAGGKIFFDRQLVVSSSARRINSQPAAFLIEYPLRVIKTLKANQSALVSRAKYQ